MVYVTCSLYTFKNSWPVLSILLPLRTIITIATHITFIVVECRSFPTSRRGLDFPKIFITQRTKTGCSRFFATLLLFFHTQPGLLQNSCGFDNSCLVYWGPLQSQGIGPSKNFNILEWVEVEKLSETLLELFFYTQPVYRTLVGLVPYS